MRCVVTGGSGFIGSFICWELAKDANTEVVVFDTVLPDYDWPMPANLSYVNGDIRVFEEVRAATVGADEVYDIAGILGTSELLELNSRAIETNIGGAVNVLEACRINGVKRVFHPTKPNDWLNTYSITKFASEQFCLMFHQQYDMSITCLKWFNAYGPRQHPYPIRKLLPTFCLQAIYGQPLMMFGDGSQTVDLIHVEDIAKIAVETTRSFGKVGKVIDVGSGTAMTVREVAEAVIKEARSDSVIKTKPMRPGEPEKSDIRADVVALRELMDIELTDFFAKGLPETMEYYRKLPVFIVRNAFEYWNEPFGIEEPKHSVPEMP